MQGSMNVRDVIGYAARGGVAIGLYLTLISSCMVLSLHNSLLAFVGLVLTAGVPVVLWRFLRGMRRSCGCDVGFGSLWLGGIYYFVFGSLICGFLTALYLLFVEPTFLTDYVRMGIDSWHSAGSPAEMKPQIDVMQRAIERKMIPGPMELVVSMIWSTAFFGSLLSAVEAMLLSSVRYGRF